MSRRPKLIRPSIDFVLGSLFCLVFRYTVTVMGRRSHRGYRGKRKNFTNWHMPAGIVFVWGFLIAVFRIKKAKNKQKKSFEEKLLLARQELTEKAHKAGMADIAAGTLHNVGNILNSVKTSCQILQETLETSGVESLGKANTLLQENLGDLPAFFGSDRGPKLVQYLRKVENHVVSQYQLSLQHSQRLFEGVNAIADVISAQQVYTRGRRSVIEQVRLYEVVEHAVTMMSGSISKKQVTVENAVTADLYAMCDKTKLVHVLINLIKNALEAMGQQRPTDQPLLQISSSVSPDFMVQLFVTDNGPGMDENMQQRVFAGGFSTKATGNGVGLRSCLQYMTEMNGSIAVQSPPVHRPTGCTFILGLPQKEDRNE